MNNRFVDEFHPSESDIVICGSKAQKNEWLKVIDLLRDAGLRVATPYLGKSNWSTFTSEEAIERKGWLIRRHLANIATTKAVLICNYEKNGIKNYIGSNSFLEMGAAFVYGKKLFVLHDIPDQDNREEILALQPVALHGDLQRLLQEIPLAEKVA